jgi:DNA-binding CsgD family transcriptional regulator
MPRARACAKEVVDGDDGHRSTVESAGSCEEASFDLRGVACSIVCVDGAMPRQIKITDGTRPRHVYHREELAHFCVGDHRFALVVREQEDEAAASANAGARCRDWRAVLTNRELQIVQLICMGLLTKQVAARLHLSEFTVRSYLKTIYCKLGVRSRGSMVYAYTQVFGVLPQSLATDADSAVRPPSAAR